MTSSGYVVAMRAVRIADPKARLSEYLRAVRRGEAATVLDRETPIARISPYSSEASSLQVRRPRPDTPALPKVPLPRPLRVKADIVALLMEERQRER